MIIQSLIKGEDLGDVLYLRYKGDTRLASGDMLGTDTYFNACSVGKWFSYCDIGYIELRIRYSGDFRLDIFQADYKGSACIAKMLASIELTSCRGEESEYVYRIDPIYQGVVYYRITAVSDNVEIYSADYVAFPSKPVKDITMALNICTFKREHFLLRNIKVLEDNFLNNTASALYGRLKIFITDNGNTLDCDALSSEDIHVHYNPNVGGAGGFTRGLIEISKYAERDSITNVVFMDDDVKIEPEAILRTYRLLCLLKDEYKDSFISGAMLSLNKPYIQHENGAVWNMGRCVFVNRGLDLRKLDNIAFNEMDSSSDYAAWWYCCIPMSVVRSDNLPIPVFIHEDDVEYSLRNAKGIITMNGIAVWHPVAETIRLSSNEYYNLRNLLIVNAVHCPGYSKLMLCRKMLVNFGAALLRFRYRDMRLILMALEDFCRGTGWLLALDAPSYHKFIQKTGYELYDVTDRLHDYEIGRNAFYMSRHPRKLKWSRKRILFDKESGKGIEVKFSFSQIFVFIAMYLKSLYLIFFKYEGSRKEYQREFKRLTNEEYWDKVLGI